MKIKIPKILQRLKSTKLGADIRQSFVTSIVPLILAPFSIYIGFSLNSYLAKPLLSIEYVHQKEQHLNVNKENVLLSVEFIAETKWYHTYLTEAYSNPLFKDIRVIEYSQMNDKDIISALEHYKLFLVSAKQKEKSLLQSIDTTDSSSKFFALDEGEDVSLLDDKKKLDLKYLAVLQKNILEITEQEKLIDSTIEDLSNKQKIVTYFYISILNKGSNDGLIRNIGGVESAGKQYEIQRIKFPDSASKAFAVPTYVVNRSFDSFSKEAIGKVEKHTMREFLFAYESKKDRGSICKNGTLKLILYNQDKSEIEKSITCITEKTYAQNK